MEQSLRVATLNLRGRYDHWLARRRLVVAEFLDAQPDLIALQEISLLINQGRWLVNQLNVRLTGTSREPYRIVQARRTHPRNWLEGVGVITRLPVQYSETIDLGEQGRVALRVNVTLPAQVFGRDSLDFVSLHLYHLAEGTEVRLEQVMRVVGRLNEGRRVPLQVIAGDFNELPAGPAVQYMRQSYRSAYAERHGRDPYATFPTNLVQPPINWSGCLDYVFLSRAVYTVHRAAIFCDNPAADDETLYPSDHVGLVADIGV